MITYFLVGNDYAIERYLSDCLYVAKYTTSEVR